MEHQTDSKQKHFMETKYMDGKSLSLYHIIQSNVRYVPAVFSPLWEITFPTISRPPSHIIRSAPHSYYMTAYLLAASGCDRCGPCATYQLIWLICAMIACGRLFTMLQLQGRRVGGGRARNRNRPLPDLRSAKVSVPQCSLRLLT